MVQTQGQRWKAGAVKAGREEGAGRRGEDGGEAGGLLQLERGRRGAVSWASGARVQVRQRRRWRPLSAGTRGGLSVQFCGERAVSLGRGVRSEEGGGGKGATTYSAHNHSTALAFSDHVAGTFTYFPARYTVHWGAGSAAGPRLVRYAHALGQLGAQRGIFVDAAEALVDKLFAVLEQISTELPASPGEVVQGVQIEQAGQLRDYAVGSSC